MDEQPCDLCGMNRYKQKLEPQQFVTIEVVQDSEGEMLGGPVKHHTLYLCKYCRWDFGKKQPGILQEVDAFLENLLVQLVTVVPWGRHPRQEIRSKLQKIAAARHGGPGPVRVFTLEQFEKFQTRKHGVDGKPRRPPLSGRGKTVDLGDSSQPDEFILDEDDDSMHYPEKGERSQRSDN